MGAPGDACRIVENDNGIEDAALEGSGAADDIQEQVTVWSRKNERKPSGPGVTASLDRSCSHGFAHPTSMLSGYTRRKRGRKKRHTPSRLLRIDPRRLMSKLLHVLNVRPGINSGIAVRAALTAQLQYT
jgi:hypothetical protein